MNLTATTKNEKVDAAYATSTFFVRPLKNKFIINLLKFSEKVLYFIIGKQPYTQKAIYENKHLKLCEEERSCPDSGSCGYCDIVHRSAGQGIPRLL